MPLSSPFADLHLPPQSVTLPLFLLGNRSKAAQTDLFFPAPAHSIFTPTRPLAKALSLVDVEDRAYAVANGLLSGRLGFDFQKGDVILIFTANQHDYVANVLGITLAGGVAALCNPAYKPRELLYNIKVTGPKAILTSNAADVVSPPSNESRTALEVVEEALKLLSLERKSSIPVFCFEEGRSDSWENVYSKEELSDEKKASIKAKHESTITSQDAAVLCFSSGTSGMPKAVSLSHGALIANVIQGTFALRDRLNLPQEDGARYHPDGKTTWYHQAETSRAIKTDTGRSTERIIGVLRTDSAVDVTSIDEFHIDVLPQFHCYGLMIQLIATHTCTPRIVMPRFHLPTFLASIQDNKATSSFIVPPILLALAKHPLIDKYDLSSLRILTSGAASLSSELAQLVSKRLGIPTANGYGMTEMSPIVAVQSHPDITKAPGSIGKLAPSTKAMLLDLDGNEVTGNEPGELLLSGPQQMMGYWKDDEANKRAFYTRPEDGSTWYRTGDVVLISKDGFLTITDRLKDVIKVKGFQVSPVELEGILYEDTRVQDVAVVGIVIEEREVPWAFVVASPACSNGDAQAKKELEASILSSINSQVAAYKKVQGLTWLEALPKSASGKVLKKDLPALRT